MDQIIHLLPDSVANQIAAGEVIQRPASVVKELLENSIDSGAKSISLIVRDAGSTLVQVTDNGKGMSEADADLAFARHATSKISQAEDLFSIRTKGFRGEALASIASVAQVTMKTRQAHREVGVQVDIEGSQVVFKGPVAAPVGTTIAVKNLFYNIPARRKFLKSNEVEFKHIVEEFERVALAHPEVAFVFHRQDTEFFNLPAGNLRQRIVRLFGKSYNEKLVPVSQETSIIHLDGFVGKPEYSRKTRGEQFFFVNNRFIKSNYLHHAVSQAYEDLIQNGSYPSYFIFMEVDPALIDINIHPTKTEIKFEDERAIFSIIRSSVKQALGQHNMVPSLDFEQIQAFQIDPLPAGAPAPMPMVTVDKTFNPFASAGIGSRGKSTDRYPVKTSGNWEKLYEGFKNSNSDPGHQEALDTEFESKQQVVQVARKYILSTIKSGVVIIHQQRAHERILYDRILKAGDRNLPVQRLLFPITVDLPATAISDIESILDEIHSLGFEVRVLSKSNLVIEGLPADLEPTEVQPLFEQIAEVTASGANAKEQIREKVAVKLAGASSIKSGKVLDTEEMRILINDLFACAMPYTSPAGLPTVFTYTTDELDKYFDQNG